MLSVEERVDPWPAAGPPYTASTFASVTLALPIDLSSTLVTRMDLPSTAMTTGMPRLLVVSRDSEESSEAASSALDTYLLTRKKPANLCMISCAANARTHTHTHTHQ